MRAGGSHTPSAGRCGPGISGFRLCEMPMCDAPWFPLVATLHDWKFDLYDKVCVCAQDRSHRDVFMWLKRVV